MFATFQRLPVWYDPVLGRQDPFKKLRQQISIAVISKTCVAKHATNCKIMLLGFSLKSAFFATGTLPVYKNGTKMTQRSVVTATSDCKRTASSRLEKISKFLLPGKPAIKIQSFSSVTARSSRFSGTESMHAVCRSRSTARGKSD